MHALVLCGCCRSLILYRLLVVLEVLLGLIDDRDVLNRIDHNRQIGGETRSAMSLAASFMSLTPSVMKIFRAPPMAENSTFGSGWRSTSTDGFSNQPTRMGLLRRRRIERNVALVSNQKPVPVAASA